MSEGSPVRTKSYAFAVAIVRTMRQLQAEQREYELSRQCLRSGTSIGANVEEAGGAVSRNDFIAKMAIAAKEARETHYWLRLLRDSRLLGDQAAAALLAECEELIRLLTAIVKTSQSSPS